MSTGEHLPKPPFFSEAQSWRKRNMTHQCSHERAPASAHGSVHESAHQSWRSLCYNPIQRLPLECSRECSRGCPRKCTRSGLVICHLVCFHLLCSSLIKSPKFGQESAKNWLKREASVQQQNNNKNNSHL